MEQPESAITTRPSPTDALNLEIYKVVKNNPIGSSPEGYYLPDDEYGKLSTRDTIQSALGDGPNVPSLVNYVLTDAKKTFFTLVQVFSDCKDLQEAINDLMANNFNDTLLASRGLDASCFKHKLWNELTIVNFNSKRLPFILPTFDIKTFKYEFENDRILPFKALGKASSHGYFSEVRCVEMLASKQTKVKVPNKTFKVALKTLKEIGDKGADGKDGATRVSKSSTNSFPSPTPIVNSAENYNASNKTVPLVSLPHNSEIQEAGTGSDSENWRHGDIKPENILRFIDSSHDDGLGTLKLADLGRAQQHRFVTNIRKYSEHELWRTRWYEPPDLEKSNHEKADGNISRLFDIWSMGCVIFEAVLWLLYGCKNDFMDNNFVATGEKGGTQYWRKEGHGRYKLTETLTLNIDQILSHDSKSSGAIRDLVILVSERLLQINLPQDSDIYTKGCRTNARDLQERLSKIVEMATKDEEYLFSSTDPANISQPRPVNPGLKGPSKSSGSSSLSVDDARRVGSSQTLGRGTAIAQKRDYTNTMKGEWKITPEGPNIMESFLKDRSFGSSELVLCSYCDDINILSSQTRISRHMNTLKIRSEKEDCDLCELIYSAAHDQGLTDRSEISLKRLENNFVLEGTNQKFLRLIATEQNKMVPSAPSLVRLEGDLVLFMKLPLEWLEDCDKEHGDLCVPNRKSHVLPTRLISVRRPKKPKIIDTADLSTDISAKEIRYVALSHRWGDMPDEAKTTRKNIEQRKEKIPMDELPLSFKDAIAVTSALRCPYLWIDSLCILQGADGDFDKEADRMQTTFNGAYCVLVACSAHSARDGFLRNRKSRPECVKVGNVFVSPVTIDFERDVLESTLSRRGWVLQERALARRTIYFTDTQTYWECGDGIRCEALVMLKNDRAAFLGDPNFPGYTIRPESRVGEQIDLLLTLFNQYTRLELSHPEDRPIAIDGLIERLAMAFKTRSLAGIFGRYWGRCLLWRRDGSIPLKKIPHGQHSRKVPPTWSWMAFEGPISFIEPKGDQVGWNTSDVTLPFDDNTDDQASWLSTSFRENSLAIRAKAFDFTKPDGASSNEVFLCYDAAEIISAKCVIIGIEKQPVGDAGRKKHYILIVKPISDLPGTEAYERCGVGYVLGKFIHDSPSFSITIE
ncbi:hypothetical protein DSL72_002125 [Monilinia vaccinii-corymbosi]|uniref:Protein kinase domain-containing protein n=1 Tax=Monilinia vaccinii-corymbosi TaxID=61207 RepID=A0A8A3PBT6_9HELO|nr:hypothetical protein DSL72_002125 [Monilinia vaccinii-corymbosi]